MWLWCWIILHVVVVASAPAHCSDFDFCDHSSAWLAPEHEPTLVLLEEAALQQYALQRAFQHEIAAGAFDVRVAAASHELRERLTTLTQRRVETHAVAFLIRWTKDRHCLLVEPSVDGKWFCGTCTRLTLAHNTQ